MNRDDHLAIITKFFSYHNDEPASLTKGLLVDLYRAITCYRHYGDLDTFLKLNPEMEECKEDIAELFREFSSLSPEELACVSIELLTDIK